MDESLPAGFFWDEKLALGDETTALTKRVWPNYIVEETDLPEPSLTFRISHEELARRFPVWGIRREADQKLVAFGHGVLIHADLTKPWLPDAGWRFAIEAVFSEKEPNCMCLLVANVDSECRGLGFAKYLVKKSKTVTLACGFDRMIAPVRPTLKHEFPDLSIGEYLRKEGNEGEVFDPWLKLHLSLGGEMLNPCHESVIVRATLPQWRKWLGEEKIGTAREVILPLGLSPLRIDFEKNIGVYKEPNVWVRYKLP